MKISILIPYYGTWPTWLYYFLKTCKSNPQFNWIFITDLTLPKELPSNISFINLSIEKLSRLAARKLGIQVDISHPYKLVDFKPTYGIVFGDLLRDSDFWGYCDIDLLFGNLSNFIDRSVLMNFDIISPHKHFFPGHFCLFRNKQKINTLYQTCSNWKEVLASPRCYCFDEFLYQPGIDLHSNSIEDLTFSRINKHLKDKRSFLRIGSVKIQKFISKYLRLSKKTIYDFNSAIFQESQQRKIRLWNKTIFLDDIQQKIKGKQTFSVDWNNSRLYVKNKEIAYYHFQMAKFNNGLGFEKVDNNSFKLSIQLNK